MITPKDVDYGTSIEISCHILYPINNLPRIMVFNDFGGIVTTPLGLNDID